MMSVALSVEYCLSGFESMQTQCLKSIFLSLSCPGLQHFASCASLSVWRTGNKQSISDVPFISCSLPVVSHLKSI